MPSTFAWLDQSEEQRRRVLDVIDMFKEQGTVDELGLGTVRDALPDILFPGTSNPRPTLAFQALHPTAPAAEIVTALHWQKRATGSHWFMTNISCLKGEQGGACWVGATKMEMTNASTHGDSRCRAPRSGYA